MSQPPQPSGPGNSNVVSSEDRDEWTVIDPVRTGGSDLERGELIDLNGEESRVSRPPVLTDADGRPPVVPAAPPQASATVPETKGGPPASPESRLESSNTGKQPASQESAGADPFQQTDGSSEGKQPAPVDAITEQIANVSIDDFWAKEEEKYGPLVIERRTESGERIPVTIMGNSSSRPASTAPATTTGPRQTQTSLHEEVQRSDEVYAVKHIRWLDPSIPENSPENPRTTQILLQNENGPCPLLALVNALMLSVPLGQETALSRTLKLRETVSLGLLLDAVFDELMTRSGGLGDNLDVADVFAFLMTLHTGMNVNPDFTSDNPTGAGTFEKTKEISLYSAFNVPLVHGWLPEPGSEASKCLSRSAKTYEDTQTFLLGEEELLSRLGSPEQNSDGVSVEQKIHDIERIRDFLERHSTQLTPYGLKKIFDALDGIGIMFRNDHFATVLRMPTTFPHTSRRPPTLLTLVTDAGFGSYEEVVFETLVSVNGEGGEFLSGDYRPVGGIQGQDHRRRQVTQQTGFSNTRSPPLIPPHGADLPPPRSLSIQQASNEPSDPSTDYDLALAISLQEEEDNIARQNRARAQSHNSPPRPQPGRPVQPLVTSSSDPDALPSYEEVVFSGARNRASSASQVQRGQQARSLLDEFNFQNGQARPIQRPRQSLPPTAFQEQSRQYGRPQPGPSQSEPAFQRQPVRPPQGNMGPAGGGGGGGSAKKDCVIM